jgi:hypothetical protein
LIIFSSDIPSKCTSVTRSTGGDDGPGAPLGAVFFAALADGRGFMRAEQQAKLQRARARVHESTVDFCFFLFFFLSGALFSFVVLKKKRKKKLSLQPATS